MKKIKGIWLPDGDTHFAAHLEAGPEHDGAGTYQFAKIDMAMKMVPTERRGMALDIGGHVGLWSRVLASCFRGVIAFEPVPHLAECFRRNAPTVQIHEVAVSDYDGKLQMQIVDDNSGNCHVMVDGEGSPAALKVPCVKIDSLNIHGVDFMKLDVEGYETRVLIGAKQTIMRDKPIMVVECKPGNAERYGLGQTAAVNLLRSWGADVMWQKSGDFCLAWADGA